MKPLPTLRRQQDLDRVFKLGRWRRLRAVAVGIWRRDDAAPTRVAYVAGQRIGTAVRRNRARRRLREALRSFADEIAPGADVVVAARDQTVDVDFQALTAAIRHALVSEGLVTDNKAEDQARQ